MRSLRPLLFWSSFGLVVWAGYAVSQIIPQPGPPTLIGCAFNTVPPTLTSGQAGWAQCDSSGKIITSSAGGGGPATIADGADVAEGATTDAAATAGSTGSVSAKLRLMTTQLSVISANLAAPINPVGITPIDRTITSTSGASQQIMAANASRHTLLVVNTGNANCGVNPTGGTAAIGGAGTLTIAPLGSYYAPVPTLSAVTVICTSGQPIYANEN